MLGYLRTTTCPSKRPLLSWSTPCHAQQFVRHRALMQTDRLRVIEDEQPFLDRLTRLPKFVRGFADNDRPRDRIE